MSILLYCHRGFTMKKAVNLPGTNSLNLRRTGIHKRKTGQ